MELTTAERNWLEMSPGDKWTPIDRVAGVLVCQRRDGPRFGTWLLALHPQPDPKRIADATCVAISTFVIDVHRDDDRLGVPGTHPLDIGSIKAALRLVDAVHRVATEGA